MVVWAVLVVVFVAALKVAKAVATLLLEGMKRKPEN